MGVRNNTYPGTVNLAATNSARRQHLLGQAVPVQTLPPPSPTPGRFPLITSVKQTPPGPPEIPQNPETFLGRKQKTKLARENPIVRGQLPEVNSALKRGKANVLWMASLPGVGIWTKIISGPRGFKGQHMQTTGCLIRFQKCSGTR